MKTDSLINKYKIFEAFVQCDYLDGFNYIDKAGEIINQLTRKNKEVPNFTMSLPGLVIEDYSSTVRELKISSTRIWIHFIDPKNLGDVEKEAKEIISSIFNVLKPTLFNRIGWRTYFAREFSKSNIDPTKNLKFSKSTKNFDIENVTLKKKIDAYDLKLELSPIYKQDKPRDFALLFDVDLGRKVDNFSLDVSQELSAIRQMLRSDEIIETFEGLLN